MDEDVLLSPAAPHLENLGVSLLVLGPVDPVAADPVEAEVDVGDPIPEVALELVEATAQLLLGAGTVLGPADGGGVQVVGEEHVLSLGGERSCLLGVLGASGLAEELLDGDQRLALALVHLSRVCGH
jgi:hypothetical protein